MKVFIADHKVNVSELNQSNDGYEYEEMSLEEYIDSLETVEEKKAAYSKFGMAVNLHYMISSRTIQEAYKVLDAMKTDLRLRYINAFVGLGLKAKGRGVKYDTVTRKQYRDLVEFCLFHEIPFGFDSCSAPAFIDAVKDHKDYERFAEMAESCESTLISSYVNEKGVFFPCSFTEGEGNWKEGIDVLTANNFIDDVWNNPRTVEFREMLLNNKDENKCNNCPVHVTCGRDYRAGSFKPVSVGDII